MQFRKDRIEIALGAGIHDIGLQTELEGSRLRVSRLGLDWNWRKVGEAGSRGGLYSIQVLDLLGAP